jgi:hypothetical protein
MRWSPWRPDSGRCIFPHFLPAVLLKEKSIIEKKQWRCLSLDVSEMYLSSFLIEPIYEIAQKDDAGGSDERQLPKSKIRSEGCLVPGDLAAAVRRQWGFHIIFLHCCM